jgi:FkbM family methyltransferase
VPPEQTIKHRLNEVITGKPFEMPVRNTYSMVYGFYKQDPNFIYDKQTRRVMARVLKKDSNCLDVGANEGMFVREMLKFAPEGDHMAFEPIPELAAKVEAKYPQVEVHNCALSDVSGWSTFQLVTNNPGYSGLRRRSYEFGEPVIKEIRVRTRTLDELYPQERPLQFVKIDVEGAEYLVLQGGKRTLKRHRPYIVFEHGRGAASFYDVRPEQLYDLLRRELDMEISVMADWLEDGPPLTRDELVDQFDNNTNYYFIAHPRPLAERGSDVERLPDVQHVHQGQFVLDLQ